MSIRKSIITVIILVCVAAYDPDLGYGLCKLTVASYCATAKVKDWSCKPCIDSPIKLRNAQPFYNSSGDVLGMIGIAPNPLGICRNLYISRFSLQGYQTSRYQKLG